MDDRDSLIVLRDAFDPALGGHELVERFYTRWFAIDPPVRDLFPPDMTDQRALFARAMRWVLDQFVEQRAEEPVAFLAQLGRDHRKYGVSDPQYVSLHTALHRTMRRHLTRRWIPGLEETLNEALAVIVGVMSAAAAAETGPRWWDGSIVEHQRVSRDLAVVRVRLDSPMPYLPGQYVKVETPQCPRRWRNLSPAMPPDPGGGIEFHVRAVPGGIVSNAIVAETRTGDRWRLSAPLGAMQVHPDGGDVLMVAGSTGLAPLRAIILDMARFGENPRVHLFFGGRYPCELYDLKTLWQVAAHNPWLSVSPVTEYNHDPPWAGDYPDVQPPRGLHLRQTGRLAEVVTGYGAWSDRQILISGGPAMVAATKAALIAKGTPPQRIQHDLFK